VKTQAEFLDAANDAIFVRSLDNRITYWNKGAERLYGWKKEEAWGKPVDALLHTQFPLPLEQVIEKAAEGGWEGELAHTKRDGSKVTVTSRWTTLNAQQVTLGWLEISSDITRRRAAEGAAHRLSARLLRTQDDERRRIARELHDSVGQTITAIRMTLALLEPVAKHDVGVCTGR
jgi:two-component system, LuxR family, sensor kinase FixL